ncbi:MAG: hypothetical protein LBJ59_03425, partial [Zoogloeaceae bacterium]|nr:hypothetical protein [Zoogloeaceae bacterium]
MDTAHTWKPDYDYIPVPLLDSENCVSAAYQTLQDAGIAISPITIPIPIALSFTFDSFNPETESAWDAFLASLPYMFPIILLPKILPILNGFYLNARAWILPVDPLVLDLDGDGIETVGINGYDTVLFDHDGDGIKTGTGWVKGDDGFLVLDRNGNGQIDSGAELFGVDTVKSNGQKATSGLDALADLDSNGDGVFDQNDAQFANVRIWQDKDQDGIADADELTTLAEQGIVSIDLNGATANKNLGNGNSQTQTAAFTREDGSTGEAGSIELAENP